MYAPAIAICLDSYVAFTFSVMIANNSRRNIRLASVKYMFVITWLFM